MLVRAVVVGDQVNLQLLGRFSVDLFEKAQPLYMGVFRLGSADDLAIEVIQGGEQRDRAMADIVMRMSTDVANTQWKSRLRAF